MKRFTLPEDQNYLRMFQKVADSDKERFRYQAGMALGEEYSNRRQYDKAARCYEKILPIEIKRGDDDGPAIRAYRQIVGNWGAFEPIETKAAGSPTTLVWKYRNAESVRFTAYAVKVPELIADIQNYFRSHKGKDTDKIEDEGIPTDVESIGWRLMNEPETKQKYLGETVAQWQTSLSPDPQHRLKRIEIPFPCQKAGAYLVIAQTRDGNSDAICLWIRSLSLVKKDLKDGQLWFVADAASGNPVPGAKVNFLGVANRWQKSRLPWLSDRGGVSRLVVKEKEYTTDENGLVITKDLGSEDGLRWMVTASQKNEATGEDDLAFFGFRSVWQNSFYADSFSSDRAFFVSDRPVYRPGDAIQYKFWVARSQYDLPQEWSWANKQVVLRIHDPLGTCLVDRAVTLDQTGGFADVLETDSDTKLGRYSFELIMPDNNWHLGGGSVRVEEYRKPEYKVTVEAPSEPTALGETFHAKIRANYYFGAPVSEATVRYTVTRTKHFADWYPVRAWDWLYGNGYGWLLPDSDWFPGWRRWGIFRPFLPWRGVRDEGIPEIVAENQVPIGPDGTVDIEIDTSIAPLLYPGVDQRYTIEAEVIDASRRTITGRGTVLASQKPYRVYCWADRGFAEPNDQIRLFVQTRRADGAPVPGIARVTVYRLRHSDGADPEETQAAAQEISLSEEGKGEWSFLAGETGQYRFAVTAVSQGENAQTAEGGMIFSVRGANTAPKDAFRNSPLEIVSEKAEYAPGETVRLSLNSSAADGTILLFPRSENGRCNPPEVIHLDGTQSTYEFPVAEGDSPNIFVEALTVHDGHYYEEQCQIPVVPEKRVLNVEILPTAKNYKPGDKAAATIRLTDVHDRPIAGDMVVAIYDQSIDAIAGDSSIPDIRQYFWSWKRHSSPSHWDNLESLVSSLSWADKERMESIGLFDLVVEESAEPALESVKAFGASNGAAAFAPRALRGGALPDGAVQKAAGAVPEAVGDDMMEYASEDGVMMDMAAEAESAPAAAPPEDSEPVVRENFADPALWIGRLTADADGKAEIGLDMPENLTTWRIRVWSFAPGTRVGEGETEVITRKDLILRIVRPRFLTQTDTAVISAVVHNFHDSPKKVALSVAADPADDSGAAVQFQGETSRVETIPAGGQTRVDWPLKALSPGNLRLVMKAVADDDSDAVAETFPIRIHGITKQEAVSGMIPPKESQGECTVAVPAERLPEQTLLTVRFSPSLAMSMIDALPYLSEYPYGCTEQTLNRFLPTVLTRRVLERLGVRLEDLAGQNANLNAQQLGSAEERLEARFAKNPIYDSKTLEKQIRAGLKKLSKMQCSDGGWGWFSGRGEYSTPYLTALVTRGLILARDAGVDVDPRMIDRGLKWLQEYLTDETLKLLNGETWSDEQKREHPDQWKSQASSIDVLVYYVLHRGGCVAGVPEPKEMERTTIAADLIRMRDYIWRDRADRSLYSLSLYALALEIEKERAAEETSVLKTADGEWSTQDRIDETIRMLRQYLVVDSENQTAYLDVGSASCWGGFWRWWSWDGNLIETQTALLRLLVRERPDSPENAMLVKYLLNNRKNGTYWNSTRDTALCVEAFCDYLAATGETAKSSKVEVLVDGQVRHTCDITPENLLTIDNTLEISELSDGEHTVTLRKTGDGPLYWNVYMKNFTLEEFIEKAGLEVKIERRYRLLTEDKEATADVVGGRGQALSQRVKKWNRTPLEATATVQSGQLVEIELLIESKNDYDFILIEDPKAAGFEPVEQLSGYDGNTLGAYVEYREDRVCFFVKKLDRGRFSVTYQVRAEQPGNFSALPATILGMYAPELAGNSDENKVEVTDLPETPSSDGEQP